MASQPHWAQLELALDGSVRNVGKRRVGGAAAVVWGPPRDGVRPILQIGSLSLPEVDCTDVAEATAAALALRLFARATDHGWRKTAILAGDSPLIQRYLGSRGKILRPHVQHILDTPLGEAHAAGRRPDAILIPRRQNGAAHREAYAAAGRAGAAAAANDITAALALSPTVIPPPQPSP